MNVNLGSLSANALSGATASLLTIGYCLSFSALLFQGELQSGLATGLWAFLVGSAIAGFYISWTTSLPPVEAGPDNPAAAVLSVLAASVSASVLAAGGDAGRAVQHVLLAFSLATLMTGLLLYGLGALRLGQTVRFIPYPVIGGFLAASGWLLVTGGIEVVTQRDFSLAALPQSIPADSILKVAIAIIFAVFVYAAKRRTGSIYVLPLAFLVGSIALDLLLWNQGVTTKESGWFIGGPLHVDAWVPLSALASPDLLWGAFIVAAPEILAVAGVTVIALLLDVTGLEVARSKTADLDHEFRSNGIASVLAAPLGGFLGNLSLNGSRLLEETGGRTRASGAIASLVVGLIAVTGFDLTRLVPTPILAGLLMYLGLVVLVEVLLRSPAQRAWADYGLALAIMVAIVAKGYLAGVILGFIGACLVFALSYGRVSVVRRHLTRAAVASNTDRAPELARLLADNGDRIHVFWLTGFIFFGSSNSVFEAIRAVIVKAENQERRYVVLDFSDVTGFDTSAMLSLVKLSNAAKERDVEIIYSGLSSDIQRALEHVDLLGHESKHKVFATHSEALDWCEERVLASVAGKPSTDGAESFRDWLTNEIGSVALAGRIAGYFEKSEILDTRLLYRQGEASDTIDIVISGEVSVSINGPDGRALFVRRMSRHTLIGEMGFFRRSPRSADVTAEAGTVIHTLSRPSFERMLSEEPELAARFLEWVVRALADRLEFANTSIAALR